MRSSSRLRFPDIIFRFNLMKKQTPCPHSRPGRFPLTAILLTFAAGPLAAQTIPNAGFETDAFSVWPGYVSDNSAITGWEGGPPERIGLNPAGGSPFADNGTIPEGTNVAFIQSQDSGTPTELSTTISGLTANTQYRLSFRINARGGQAPNLTVTVDGNELLRSNVHNVAGAAPYRTVNLLFTAVGTTAQLVLQNQQTTDTTVVVDDFKVTAAPTPAWSFEAWTDSSTSGLDPQYNYTHLYNFNSTATPGINGLFFQGITGGNPMVAGKFSVTGMGGTFANDGNSLSDGDNRLLANDFIYAGDPGTLNLEGLKPNTPYVLNIYSVAFDAQNTRWINFQNTDSMEGLTVDQDSFGNDSGIRIIHSYTSSAEGKVSVTTRGLSDASFHMYGFSNREVVPAGNIAPVIAAQPVSTRVIAGDTVTLSSGASGVPVPAYQWLLNGNPISDGEVYTGATTNALQINGKGGAGAGYYTLRAQNVMGSVTSNPAYVEVYVPKAGPLFSTGVDASGTPLPETDGNGSPSEDPHYKLTVNPDGEPNIPAVVQTGIPSPPWIANSSHSNWIGSLPNTGSGAVGQFTYSTTVDAGDNPAAFNALLFYAVDNLTNAILVNGQPATGIVLSQGFDRYTIANLNTVSAPSLHAGVNTVDFVVENLAPPGPTGLRVASVEVPAGIQPVIVQQPLTASVVDGSSVTLSARAYGSGVITYQWMKNGANIAGAVNSTFTIGSFSAADNAAYSVKATNALGSATSTEAVLDVRYPVGGLFSSGVDETGTVLEDGADDPHYQLLFSADGTNEIQAVVHGSDIFPIVAGPWVANSATSKWISPRLNSAQAGALASDGGAGPGTYVYRTTFDLTGFAPASAIISGQWTSDNQGLAIRVNGNPTGITGSGNFGGYEAFRIDDVRADFASGVNTLDFVVQNADATAGYTGLRVEGISVIAAKGQNVSLPPISISLSANGKPVISFQGTAGVTYPIQRSIDLTPSNSWSVIGQAVAAAGGAVQFEDVNAPTGRAFYRVVFPQ
ncbi:MAG: Endoglucanase [Verrucomicrobiales bacterium]|nr:Endoglucanase [Verrucomicrobiales bacterium]